MRGAFELKSRNIKKSQEDDIILLHHYAKYAIKL